MYRTTNRPNTRIEVADALRGIAVAGIILFHAREHFNLYWSALDLPRAGFGSWEQPVADMLGFLLSGKMYAIFALLFGLSFFIQSDNQAQRGNDFSLRFAWRMVLLFGIGLVNAAIYNGDVLTYYALFGLLMIPIGKLPNRWVWVIAALLFIQPLELWQYFSGHTLSIRGIEGMETLYPTLATGTFAESARVSLLYGPLSSFGWGLEHGRGTQTLLMFVLGMLAGRYRLFYDEGQHRRIWGGLLAVGIAGTWLVPFEAMRNLMTATAIVSTVVLLWYGWPGFRRALHGMTFFGRMSLTNYLLQSLLGTALFYNWGLGLYRHVDVIYGTWRAWGSSWYSISSAASGYGAIRTAPSNGCGKSSHGSTSRFSTVKSPPEGDFFVSPFGYPDFFVYL